MTVLPPPSAQLTISLAGQGTSLLAEVTVQAQLGQREILQASTNFVNWVPVATNVFQTNNSFEFFDTNEFPWRFYRAILGP